MQEGAEQVGSVSKRQELREMFVFDFDGTLTKKAGQETFDMFKAGRSAANVDDVEQLITQGAFDNHMVAGAYRFLRAALEENAYCQVVIISRNYSVFIRAMLTHQRFQDQGCLTADEFEKIVIYDRYSPGNKADRLVRHLRGLSEEQKPHEIHIYDDSEEEIVVYRWHQTLTKDYQCHLYQKPPGEFNWTTELQRFFNPPPAASGTISNVVSVFYRCCCGSRDRAEDEESLLAEDSEDRSCYPTMQEN
jgi:hypothetical protein